MAGHDYHQHFILGRIYLYSGPHLKLKRDNGNVHYERLHFSIYSIFPYIMYIKEVMGLWPIGACSRRYI